MWIYKCIYKHSICTLYQALSHMHFYETVTHNAHYPSLKYHESSKSNHIQICRWFYHQKKKTLVLIYVGKTRVIENLFLWQCLRHCLLKEVGLGSIYLSSVVINHLKTNYKSNMLNFKVLMGSLCPLWQGYNYCSINQEQFTPKLHIITMKFKIEWHEHEFNS
jgi:hypothetical protein